MRTECGASSVHFVGICKQMLIMAHQTHLAGHMTPHPPPHIWAHPHDQSQTTALLTHILQ